jgi:EmrB/QacA subfamily drug resistance transporter
VIEQAGGAYKWRALSCVCLGVLLATLNTGTLIIALPKLERALGTGLVKLVWVILVYMITSTALVLSAGRWSDLFGRKRAYISGFVLFGIASLAAGFTHSADALIAARFIQGVGSALLFANSSALVTDAFPRTQLGLAMGTYSMTAAVGTVLGPVVGGALVAVSWHWVFWFNAPLALIGTVWAAVSLKELAPRDDVRGFDPLGTVTYLVGISGFAIALSKAGLSGWSDPVVIGGLVAAAILLPLFVAIERRVRAPMLDLQIFADRMFAAASAAALINGLARFALMFLFVIYFQGPQGLSPVAAGLRIAPLALGMLVASPLAGRAADRRGSRMLAAAGMALTAVGLVLLTRLTVDTSYWFLAIGLSVVGIGSGLFNSPNTSEMMGSVPPHRRGIAGGTRTMLQNAGAVISICFVMAVITAAVPQTVLLKIFSGLASGLDDAQLGPFISNMHVALWALAGISALGCGVCLLRPARRPVDNLVPLRESST